MNGSLLWILWRSREPEEAKALSHMCPSYWIMGSYEILDFLLHGRISNLRPYVGSDLILRLFYESAGWPLDQQRCYESW